MLTNCGCGTVHQPGYPFYEEFLITIEPITIRTFPSIPQGWECPRCHKILNPAVNACSCPAPPAVNPFTQIIGMGSTTYEAEDITVIY